MLISMSKKNLLHLLEKKLKQAEVEDARVTKKHEKEEVEALNRARASLRKCLMLPYKIMKKRIRYNDNIEIDFGAPVCPVLTAPKIKAVIKMVQMDERRVDAKGNEAPYQIREDDEIHKAIVWEPEASREKVTVCD